MALPSLTKMERAFASAVAAANFVCHPASHFEANHTCDELAPASDYSFSEALKKAPEKFGLPEGFRCPSLGTPKSADHFTEDELRLEIHDSNLDFDSKLSPDSIYGMWVKSCFLDVVSSTMPALNFDSQRKAEIGVTSTGLGVSSDSEVSDSKTVTGPEVVNQNGGPGFFSRSLFRCAKRFRCPCKRKCYPTLTRKDGSKCYDLLEDVKDSDPSHDSLVIPEVKLRQWKVDTDLCEVAEGERLEGMRLSREKKKLERVIIPKLNKEEVALVDVVFDLELNTPSAEQVEQMEKNADDALLDFSKAKVLKEELGVDLNTDVGSNNVCSDDVGSDNVGSNSATESDSGFNCLSQTRLLLLQNWSQWLLFDSLRSELAAIISDTKDLRQGIEKQGSNSESEVPDSELRKWRECPVLDEWMEGTFAVEELESKKHELDVIEKTLKESRESYNTKFLRSLFLEKLDIASFSRGPECLHVLNTEVDVDVSSLFEKAFAGCKSRLDCLNNCSREKASSVDGFLEVDPEVGISKKRQIVIQRLLEEIKTRGVSMKKTLNFQLTILPSFHLKEDTLQNWETFLDPFFKCVGISEGVDEVDAWVLELDAFRAINSNGELGSNRKSESEVWRDIFPPIGFAEKTMRSKVHAVDQGFESVLKCISRDAPLLMFADTIRDKNDQENKGKIKAADMPCDIEDRNRSMVWGIERTVDELVRREEEKMVEKIESILIKDFSKTNSSKDHESDVSCSKATELNLDTFLLELDLGTKRKFNIVHWLGAKHRPGVVEELVREVSEKTSNAKPAFGFTGLNLLSDTEDHDHDGSLKLSGLPQVRLLHFQEGED